MPKTSVIIKTALVGIIGALLMVSILSSQNVTVQALDFSLSVQIFDRGYTVIDIPPLGTIRARTHQLPLMFRISLRNINLDRLGELVAVQEPEQIFTELESTLRRQVTSFLIRIIAVAFLGGFGAGYLLFRRPKAAFLAGLFGLLAFSILLGSAVLTFDENAFREPEFEGIVEAAPWLMGVAEEAIVAVQGLDEKLKIVSDNLLVLFESLRYLGGGGGTVDGDLKILHVSDIHNNPIGVSLVKQMAAAFGADLIIDTGDSTDYGTPLEADLISNIAEINLPWLVVPGNHDSPAVIAALRELDNVWVFEEDVFYFEDIGIAVAGVADPASQSTAMAVRPREEYKEAAQRLKNKIEQSTHIPSIIIAHHVYVLEEFTDYYAVLLHGHSHRLSIKTEANSLIMDAGTTGGAGIRGLMTREELPYSMILLHFNQSEGRWVAAAADIITVGQLDAGFILERKLLRQPVPPSPLGEDEDEPEDEQGEGD